MKLESCPRYFSPEAYFKQCLQAVLRPGDRVLDAGCGTGRFFDFDFARNLNCHITGADARADLSLNTGIDQRVRCALTRLPFADHAFDVVNCRLVIEHLEKPYDALCEFRRVLKTGGTLAIFTPNLLHYFGAAAKATPFRFHRWFNSRIRGIAEEDVFPAPYRANTRCTLAALLRSAGFSKIDISLVEGAPNVLAFSPLLYHCGIAYKRLVERFDFLSTFRLNIVAIAHNG